MRAELAGRHAHIHTQKKTTIGHASGRVRRADKRRDEGPVQYEKKETRWRLAGLVNPLFTSGRAPRVLTALRSSACSCARIRREFPFGTYARTHLAFPRNWRELNFVEFRIRRDTYRFRWQRDSRRCRPRALSPPSPPCLLGRESLEARIERWQTIETNATLDFCSLKFPSTRYFIVTYSRYHIIFSDKALSTELFHEE